MSDVTVYIQGEKLDLFADEKIEINMNVKNISDISKVFSDFTQSFTVPASPANNAIFTHWYDATVDGTFNGNVRIDAYIEVNSLPFRFGSVQMNEAKLKSLQPYAYSITFFGEAVNLSDKFGEDELTVLDFDDFNHDYDSDTVVTAMRDPIIANGDVYYPLINAVQEMSIGTLGDTDLFNEDNLISYRDFKPAIRMIRIVEAIEQHYGILFTREFFDRSIFYNLFLWLHKDAGQLKAYGIPVTVDLTEVGSFPSIGFTVDMVNDTISYTCTATDRRTIRCKVIPESGFNEIPYIVDIYDNGELKSSTEAKGPKSFLFGQNGIHVVQFKVRAGENFSFDTRIAAKKAVGGGTIEEVNDGPVQNVIGHLYVKDQLPQIKVKDFINSLISQFNLVIRPINKNYFTVDTLDNWYSQGKAYDITPLVDIKDVTVKRIGIKKLVSFLYAKAGAILGFRYNENFAIGYGDLRATFDTSGDDLKIETKFENMLFERLQDETTGDLSELQAGYSITPELEPYKGAPFMFYRNGYADSPSPIIIQPNTVTLNRIWHTATEDNIQEDQITNSLNFGSDVSTYFLTEVTRGLYFNFWKKFIEELFDRKSRGLSIKLQLPAYILYGLKLNDRFVFQDKKYKLSNVKVSLTDSQATADIFTDMSPPFDSVEVVRPLTVDSTEITVDTESITVDTESLHDPVISYVDNGISTDNYSSTASEEYFEVAISANTNWAVTKVDTGAGVTWFGTNVAGGNRSGFVRAKVNRNTGAYRTGKLRFTIAGVNYDLLIEQGA